MTVPDVDGRIEVSVVIPCLDEAQSLGICIDKALAAFQAAGLRGEVVVADNGSTDGSVDVARRHGARVVQVAARGYGNALRGGIEAARGAFIVMGDADDSYDFVEVPRFVAKWREGFDVVMGNRFRGGIRPGAMPWHHRYVGNPVLTWILNLFFHTGVGDAHCGMRGFTKAVYMRLDLRTTGMEFALELLVKAARLGARIAEIPVTLWPDKRGRPSHLRSFRDGWRHLRFLLLYAPNWLFLGPGLCLLLLGAALVLWLLPGPRFVGRVMLDVHTMLFGMVFALLGAQIISLGLFAKVFSLLGALRPGRAVTRARAPSHDARARARPRDRAAAGRARGQRVGRLAVGRGRLRHPSRDARRDLLLALLLPRGTDRLLVVLPQHAGHQPGHLHRRLRATLASPVHA
jgi:glycosyltransferase involved in cell wall biosynthesis